MYILIYPGIYFAKSKLPFPSYFFPLSLVRRMLRDNADVLIDISIGCTLSPPFLKGKIIIIIIIKNEFEVRVSYLKM